MRILSYIKLRKEDFQMEKKKKTSTNNQWTSLPEEDAKCSCSKGKKEKTAADNQWTSTLKNNANDK